MQHFDIQQNVSLKPFNTFGVDVTARAFVVLHSMEQLEILLHTKEFHTLPSCFIGGGSNVLLVHDFPGLVIVNQLQGKEIKEQNVDSVLVHFASGENWHDCVTWAVHQGWGGIENLALIPGTVGGAPVQNIGAYGAEIKDVLVSVDAIDLIHKNKKTFTVEECAFGYRDSYFKNQGKGHYFITGITVRLQTQPQINTQYVALRDYLLEQKKYHPTIRDVYEAVIAIRSSKLPDWHVLGNAGSFFKNPIVSLDQVEALRLSFPDMPVFDVNVAHKKIPAGWLIEQAGWKGKKIGNVGVHEKQALVLVNLGNATGQEIFDVAEAIIKDVQEKFHVSLEMEVTVI